MVQRFRAMHRRVLASSQRAPEDKARQLELQAARLMPEYSLAHLLHLLAHDKSFPAQSWDEGHGDDEVSHLFRFQISAIDMLIDGLISTAPVAGAGAVAVANNSQPDVGSIGFMLNMLQRLKQCEDVQDPTSDVRRSIH